MTTTSLRGWALVRDFPRRSRRWISSFSDEQQHQQDEKRRRVVVTGMGAVTPLGPTLSSSWEALVSSSSDATSTADYKGITSLEEALSMQALNPEEFDREWKLAKTLPCQVAAAVPHISRGDGRTSRFVQLALQAGAEAMQQAQLSCWLTDNAQRQERAGVCIGSGMSGMRDMVQAILATGMAREDDADPSIRKLSPHFVPKILTNSAAGRLAMEWKLQGPNHAASTACAAAAHAMGDGFRFIQQNQADVMLVGGSEACIDPLSLAGFCRLRALSTAFNHVPAQASRPFDNHRDGFVMGEGACVLVLEELQHALQRGVAAHEIFGEVLGYGVTSDAHHITSPHPQGTGAARAIHAALQDAGVEPHEVDYVNAHATSTPMGDEIEEAVMQRVLMGEKRTGELYVSSTKGATGHLLGAAGAIEAAFTLLSLYQGRLAPTRNLTSPSTGVQFQHVRSDPLGMPIQVALSNSFGFGGTNACLVFRSYQE